MSHSSPHGVRTALFVTVLSVYALTNAGFDVTEGQEDLALARQMVDSGSIAFAHDPGGISAPGTDGRFYMSHDIGNAVALAPLVVTARAMQPFVPAAVRSRAEVFAASFAPGLWAALAVLAVYDVVLVGLGLDAAAAIATALALAFGSFLWPYSRSLFDGVLAAMLVTWGFAFALRARQAGGPADAARAGMLLGLAIVTRQTLLVLLPPFVLYLLWPRRDRRWLAAVGAPIAIALAWTVYYNAIRTGSPFLPAIALPKYASNNALDANIVVGFAGFFFSPGKSMFLFSPTLLLAAAGIPAFWRRRRPESLVVIGSAMLYLLMHAAVRNWAGEWGWGPRYSLIVLPLLLVPAAFAFERLFVARSPRLLVPAAALLASAVVIELASVTINWHYRYAYLSQQGSLSTRAAIWSFGHGQFADALITAATNVGRLFGRPTPIDVVAGTDPLNVIASNGVNFWWITAMHAGVPRWMAALAAGVLLATSAAGAGRLTKGARA